MSDEAPPPSIVAPLVRAPVIGRDGELALLKQIYDSVLARSEVRVATIVGPAGEYYEDYYAVFFLDPDGLKLEGMKYGERRAKAKSRKRSS